MSGNFYWVKVFILSMVEFHSPVATHPVVATDYSFWVLGEKL